MLLLIKTDSCLQKITRLDDTANGFFSLTPINLVSQCFTNAFSLFHFRNNLKNKIKQAIKQFSTSVIGIGNVFKINQINSRYSLSIDEQEVIYIRVLTVTQDILLYILCPHPDACKLKRHILIL